MIRALQKRFVLTAMTAVTVLITLMLGAINTANVIIVRGETNATLRMIAANDGDPGNIPERPPGELPSVSVTAPKNEHDKMLASNFFTVRFSPEGEAVFADVSHVASVTEESARKLAAEAYGTGVESGKLGRFRYAVTDSRHGPGKTVVFLDVSEEKLSYLRVLLLSGGVGVACWLLMLLLVILLSQRAIRPIAENIAKQKQFVTDAGHEIKTPLAIIRANTDAMELYNGENKWLRNIREQTVRLDGLMKNLLLLAKADEGTVIYAPSEFSLSALVTEVFRSFSESVGQKDIAAEAEIGEDVSLNADREQLTQLISILLDNAVKYTDEGGYLAIRLKKTEKSAVLEVENTCTGLPDVPPDKLFDRFYRADAARTQGSGGYGIGLSVARSVAQRNHGKITAARIAPDRIRFTVVFQR